MNSIDVLEDIKNKSPEERVSLTLGSLMYVLQRLQQELGNNADSDKISLTFINAIVTLACRCDGEFNEKEIKLIKDTVYMASYSDLTIDKYLQYLKKEYTDEQIKWLREIVDIVGNSDSCKLLFALFATADSTYGISERKTMVRLFGN